jgi:hypothetical protein
MTIPIIKIKIFRKSVVKARMDVRFPANVAAANFVTITRANGTYTFAADYSVLTPGPILDSTTSYIAISDTTAGIYRTVTLASLLTSGLDADLQAIAALAGTGVLVRTATNTWVLRTLAGTANEITVTNGDGVSGAPTLSLPTALTFTGKTVTGGTFSSPALVTPALGTPASGVATNLTGTASGLTAGHVTTNANLTGPVTSVGNATSVTANSITNAMRAQMAAYTLKGNATGVTANEADIDVTALTVKASPVSADILLIQDSAASNAFKKVTLGTLPSSAGVSTFNTLSGAVTTSVVVQKFTASGTYTPTAGMLHAVIECVGGGGGGGGVTGAASQYYSGGGGSGGYSRSYTTATAVGASKAVTIGAAGAGGAGSNNGTAGGATSVGTLCVANGGSGGLFCSGAQVGFGGDGATAGTGDIIAAGMPGASGMYSSSQTIKSPGSNGGSSIFGGGGKGSTANGAATNGSAAGNYGSGGGGAAADATASTATGGAGSAGFVIITEYVNL